MAKRPALRTRPQACLDCINVHGDTAARYGLAVPDDEVLAMAIKDTAKVGAKTAAEAARAALEVEA